jgi:outer membrane murein-binding lipoprotein Lpp
MSWKDDFFARTEKLSVDVRRLDSRLDDLHKDLETALAIIAQKVEAAQEAYGKMADRLISMAMVQRGDTKSAAVYRSQERLEKAAGEKDDWDEPEEEQWPPPNCTRVDQF